MPTSKKRNTFYIVVAITLLFVLFSANLSAQCAMCKAAAESELEKGTKSLAAGLNTGILFLMAVPYIGISILFRKEIALFFRQIKTKERQVFDKKRLQKFTFAITFATVIVLLFTLFMIVK